MKHPIEPQRSFSGALWERRFGYCRADRTRVVRTRMFVTDISRSAEFGRAHGELFAGHPPDESMLEVRRLIDARMLIEIEANAVLG